MPSDESEIDAAIDNLAKIKTGTDPRDPLDGDPLSIAREEVDRLFDEHDLDEYIDRGRISVAVARWKRKNGYCAYDRRVSRDRYGKRVTSTRGESVTGHHSIVINERIHEQGNFDEFIDTVRHELAHVIAYVDASCGPHGVSPGHGPGWKRWARRLGADPSACHNKKDDDYSYYIGCPNGCYANGKHRRSKRIKRPEMYRTRCCEVQCVSWSAGRDRPTTPGEKNL